MNWFWRSLAHWRFIIPCLHPCDWQEQHQLLDHSQKLHLEHLEGDRPVIRNSGKILRWSLWWSKWFQYKLRKSESDYINCKESEQHFKIYSTSCVTRSHCITHNFLVHLGCICSFAHPLSLNWSTQVEQKTSFHDSSYKFHTRNKL